MVLHVPIKYCLVFTSEQPFQNFNFLNTLTVAVIQPLCHLVSEDGTQTAPLPLLIQTDYMMFVRHLLSNTATRCHCWRGHWRGELKGLKSETEISQNEVNLLIPKTDVYIKLIYDFYRWKVVLRTKTIPSKQKINRNMCLDYVIKICTWIDDQVPVHKKFVIAEVQ